MPARDVFRVGAGRPTVAGHNHHRRPACSAPTSYAGGGGGEGMPAKQRRYTGELANPIVWHDQPTFRGAVTKERVDKHRHDYENHQRDAERQVNQKLLQKMSLLMKH